MSTGDWVAEITTTVGTGSVALGGAISAAYTKFSDVGIVDPWYVIIDGDDRETGQGTLTGNTLARTTVHATLVNGVYSDNAPAPINLSGAATVHSVLTSTAFANFQQAYDIATGITSELQNASEVPFTPAGTISSTDVQAAIVELDTDLTALSVSGVNQAGDYNWTGTHTYTIRPTFGGTQFALVSELSGGIDTTAAFDWTGQHTFTLLPTVSGNEVYTQANVTEAQVGLNAQVGTTYTTVLGDAGSLITMNNAAANTVTIPLNSSVAYPNGTVISVCQIGAGQTTIAATGGVVINTEVGLNITAQYGFATLIKTGTDTWILSGSLSA